VILHVASDIHFEFMNKSEQDVFFGRLAEQATKDGAKAIVIAGDIGLLRDFRRPVTGLRDLLDRFFSIYEQVFYTTGNHEYFGYSIQTGNADLAEYAKNRPGFKLMLPGNRATEQGVEFTGGTLWYPDCGEPFLKKYWIDYNRIHDSEPGIDEQHKAFLAQTPGKVVISHHFPTDESIAEHWKGSGNNCFFCAYIDKQLETWGAANVLPKLWIHGHTHDPFDYVSRFGPRVYCNPHGYPNEGANPNFFSRLKVEI
jgi:hypothetical protein